MKVQMLATRYTIPDGENIKKFKIHGVYEVNDNVSLRLINNGGARIVPIATPLYEPVEEDYV